MIDKKTKGAWLIHHTNKLQSSVNQGNYESTFVAGKAGILLSAISADKQMAISNERLLALAKASNINTAFELPKLLDVLRNRQLIDIGATGIGVLGITSAAALVHSSDIFESLQPKSVEKAAIELAEKSSIQPLIAEEVATELGDIYKLEKAVTKQLLYDAEQFGFVDFERIHGGDCLIFNGNLFKRETAQKVKCVMDSLSEPERRLLVEVNELLQAKSCISIDVIESILGDRLFKKLSSIGIFDLSVVSNSTEEVGFATLPSAFSKYSNPIVDDAFDLAKAFVSSITYGMTKSPWARGNIRQVDALITSLIQGESIGPVRAIAEDYKILELKGVVEVHIGTKKGRTGPMLRLLKKEVGELAIQAIQYGDVSEHSLQSLPSAAVTTFKGPEQNREKNRRKQTSLSPKETNDILSALRTGGKF